MIFETERLRVRKLRLTDLNPFHAMQSDMQVMQYITGQVASLDQSKAKLKAWIDRYQSKKMEWPFAVELKASETFIGICGIIEANEIGYRFIPTFWHKGYGTEILKGLIGYAKQLGLKDLKAEVIIENKASFRLLKNAGFTIVEEKLCINTQLPEYLMTLQL